MLIKLIAALRTSYREAYATFANKLSADGTYPEIEDIAIYYKHPLMYQLFGDENKANKILDHIKQTYLRDNGDFLPQGGETKSSNLIYQEFYAYTNGWIIRAANKLHKDHIIHLGLGYLTTFENIKNGGFYTHNPQNNDGITDAITTAHLGLVNLEVKNIITATAAGNYLCELQSIQPDLNLGFYLRRDREGSCITDFTTESTLIHIVKKNEPNQLYFMLAYPIAFLIELYKNTKHDKYLRVAEQYADFALSCHPSVLACEFSHKLAWALSSLYEFNPKETYLQAVDKIVSFFISLQDQEKLWFSNDPLKCYDQSAEIICWFIEIAAILERIELKKNQANAISTQSIFSVNLRDTTDNCQQSAKSKCFGG